MELVSARVVTRPPTRLPDGKRLPRGWSALEIGREEETSVHLRWPAWEGAAVGNGGRLRITVALDYRDARFVEARLPGSGALLGRFDIRYAYAFQPFELALNAEQAAAALREGVSLRLDGGEQPLWMFDELDGEKDRRSFAPHLLLGEGADGAEARLDAAMGRLASFASLQPFGWMEGCVLDGLYALRPTLGAERIDAALDAHLAQYMDDEGRLLYEDLHGRGADDTFTTIEATLPLAVIAKYQPEHNVVKRAIAFWDSRGANGGGAVIDGDTVSAEGAYTVAYPLAVVAAKHDRSDLARRALEQALLRRDVLARDRDVFLRYHRNSDSHSFRNWARAYAWYMLGIARTASTLRASAFADLPGVAELERELARVAEVALSWRQRSGLWSNFLDDPAVAVDASGSAGIAAALALGARHGVLEERYLRVAEESLTALAAYVTPDGFLGGVAQHNAGGVELQRGGYRVLSQMGLGLLGQLYAAVRGA
ncbi:glycoside hydrolase family 88 protein [Paenibacillus sp.]|uniref:glycoside hydrolase family 88 protein n=1 Tax=Paenibacillus sp. TaxID=58172 RepID=UPI002811E674|nr:glycoside hydrolase family 88 protein [Paenibacillus sp.]